jgi:hypothetical protein
MLDMVKIVRRRCVGFFEFIDAATQPVHLSPADDAQLKAVTMKILLDCIAIKAMSTSSVPKERCRPFPRICPAHCCAADKVGVRVAAIRAVDTHTQAILSLHNKWTHNVLIRSDKKRLRLCHKLTNFGSTSNIGGRPRFRD